MRPSFIGGESDGVNRAICHAQRILGVETASFSVQIYTAKQAVCIHID